MAIAGGDRDILVYLIKTDQIVYKILDSADWAVWYLPIEEVDMKKNGAQWQLLSFSDAGFGALRDSSSIEAFFIGRGEPLCRDGTITCAIHPLFRNARQIKRISRSSTLAEIISLCSVADLRIWSQAVIR